MQITKKVILTDAILFCKYLQVILLRESNSDRDTNLLLTGTYLKFQTILFIRFTIPYNVEQSLICSDFNCTGPD